MEQNVIFFRKKSNGETEEIRLIIEGRENIKNGTYCHCGGPIKIGNCERYKKVFSYINKIVGSPLTLEEMERARKQLTEVGYKLPW